MVEKNNNNTWRIMLDFSLLRLYVVRRSLKITSNQQYGRGKSVNIISILCFEDYHNHSRLETRSSNRGKTIKTKRQKDLLSRLKTKLKSIETYANPGRLGATEPKRARHAIARQTKGSTGHLWDQKSSGPKPTGPQCLDGPLVDGTDKTKRHFGRTVPELAC